MVATPFSCRTNWELSENKITFTLDKLKEDNIDIINLTESNPTKCNFHYPAEIVSSLSSKENLSYSPHSQGNLLARKAVSAYYKTMGLNVDEDAIFLTSSTSEGYCYLFRILADTGDNVIFPRPSYPLFQFLTDLNDVKMKNYSLAYDKAWSVDFDSLLEEISIKTKAVAVVNPNNPTGSFIKECEKSKLNKICKENNLAIISDEVFFDFCFDENKKYPSFVENDEVLTFALGGLSKTLGMPQMKLSWIIISGPDDLVEEAKARLDVVADTFLSVNTPVQNACPVWLSKRVEIQQQMLNRIKCNLTFLEKELDNSKADLLKTEGGWYVAFKISDKYKEEDLVLELLKKDHVFVHPGYFFDFQDEPYVVVSLLPEQENFQKGIGRVINRLS
ncbi:MAG: pyridoxal phosphate-dependent aminotransferase [Candidatus Zapsychrus exili]|nr:pyridoxal phosphate-dependent aminotransferase [Candidatus Zapsychrus exili]